jgi:alanyl-tRNA synthetase
VISVDVIGDHIRTLSFSIADGIQPGNNDRNYVLRRILRRAVRYGRTLGFHEPFFYKLVDVLADTMGDVFPDIRARKKHVQEVIRTEEEAFNKTLDAGLRMFEEFLVHDQDQRNYARLVNQELSGIRQDRHVLSQTSAVRVQVAALAENIPDFFAERSWNYEESPQGNLSAVISLTYVIRTLLQKLDTEENAERAIDVAISHVQNLTSELVQIPGAVAFKLYDTYGFPLDLTELMARERGLTVDTTGFEELMEEQRTRARAAQKKTIIEFSKSEPGLTTKFVGFEKLSVVTKTKGIVGIPEKSRNSK